MTVTPTPSFTPLSTAPSRQRPNTFSVENDEFLGGMQGFGDNVHAIAEAAEANAQAAEDAADIAETKAGEAAASAATALNAPGTQATSSDELTLGVGTQTFDLDQLGKAFPLYQRVKISNSTSAFMIGSITAFTPGTGAMTVDVTEVVGSGTYSSWVVAPAGPEALPAASAADVRAGVAADVAATPAALRLAGAFQTLTDAATIAWDAALGFNARVTLGGNRTMGAPTSLHDGLTYSLEITQDGTGSRTLSWNAIFDWGDIGAPTLSTGVGKVDFAYGQYSSATGKLHMSFRKAAA
jgi:hypothetical protein